MSAPDIPTDYNMHTFMRMETPITMTGDPNNPISTKMTGDPNQPLATLMLGDPARPVATRMTGDANQPLATLILGDPAKPITMTMQGNPEKPVSLAMEMLNLPRFTLNDLKDLMTPKIRIRMPNYSQMCFKLFGKEIFSFCTSGERQTIMEPYVPNSRERCEVICCEPDTRPFPENNPDQHNNPNG